MPGGYRASGSQAYFGPYYGLREHANIADRALSPPNENPAGYFICLPLIIPDFVLCFVFETLILPITLAESKPKLNSINGSPIQVDADAQMIQGKYSDANEVKLTQEIRQEKSSEIENFLKSNKTLAAYLKENEVENVETNCSLADYQYTRIRKKWMSVTWKYRNRYYSKQNSQAIAEVEFRYEPNSNGWQFQSVKMICIEKSVEKVIDLSKAFGK